MTDAGNEETAANNFAAKYPTSELRRYLYSSAMLLYQRENNSEMMLAMGEKVLALDPDNPLALVLTATALADGLGDHDRDHDRKIETIRHNALAPYRPLKPAMREAHQVQRKSTNQHYRLWRIQRWES